MTKDQIDELMRENGIVIVGEAVYALCNLVEEQSAAAEREVCANWCEAAMADELEDEAYYLCKNLAAAIRARGQS